jgi:formyltetrahydrofolate deformylase
MAHDIPPSYILTLACEDVPGIVAAVSGFITRHDGFILESAQFGDPATGRFFSRVHFKTGPATPEKEAFRSIFAEKVGHPFGMDWALHASDRKRRVAIFVSKEGHCLHELLYRTHNGALPVEVPFILSNHPELEKMARWYDIPFHYLPVTKENKPAQEAAMQALLEEHKIDLVVLARYMQVLSPGLCNYLQGRAINIHHSFLPSFKGAKPYHQAFERGVKLIGATAHFVTEDLDEGPIIEQEVARVEHTHKASDLAAVGRDIEKLVLARAVRYHVEHRVLMNANKTVIFK